jgi:zinc transport system permease protein
MSLLEENSFLLWPILGGVMLALISGPLGCFVVWRRWANLGHTLSHSALLAIALAVIWQVDPMRLVLLLGLVLGFGFIILEERRWLAGDTLLGILAHSSLALGLVLLALEKRVRVDLLGLLFGDILAIGREDFVLIISGASVVLALTIGLWGQLLASTVHEDLAAAEGISPLKMRFALILLLTLTIALGMTLVGVLLVMSLLIIPPAIARRFSQGPEIMAILAAFIGILCVLGGIWLSSLWDIPCGPAIVCLAGGLFIVSALPWQWLRKAKSHS